MEDIYEELKKLNEEELLVEDIDLYKGIFWIVDLKNIENNKNYCFKIPTNIFGDVLDNTIQLNAKSGTTFNHEKVWKELPSTLTHNKEYNYYPRGRVELSNGIARIYVNPNIYTDEVKQFLINEFNLLPHNGIKRVDMKADGSDHYKCYLDK